MLARLQLLRQKFPARCHRCYSSSTAASPPYRILFCGSDTFARTSLAALHDAKDVCSSLHLLTARDPPKWKSRKRNPVALIKAWAQEAGVAQEEVPELGLDRYQLPSPFRTPAPNDLLITASFGHLLPPSLLDAFPASQRLNLHPSLLPELRGAAPIQWAIAWQMKRTGVSIQTLGDKFDSGNILAQKEVAIPPLVKYEALEEILAKHGSQLLLKVLRDLPEFAAKAWPQSEAPANIGTSLARKLKPSWSDVRWDKQTANEIEARHRAFGYLYPIKTKSSQLTQRSIILRDMNAIEDASSLNLNPEFLKSKQPGTAIISPQMKSIIIKCKDGESLLNVTRLQSVGRKEMGAADWIIGYRQARIDDQKDFIQFECAPSAKSEV